VDLKKTFLTLSFNNFLKLQRNYTKKKWGKYGA